MTLKPEVGVIMLAAGSSSRMGHNKMMLVFQGITLLERTLMAAIDSKVNHLIAVTGANREENDNLIKKHKVKVVFNTEWEAGIGSSLKCGLQTILKEYKHLDAVIISVCDQTYLSSEVFDKLIDKYTQSGKPIIASTYGNTIGVPVLYDKIFFDELMRIPDDRGAKQSIVDHASSDSIATIQFEGGDVDIDTLEDLKKMEER